MTLPVNRTRASLFCEELVHSGGEKLKLALCGSAYSFRVCGRGAYTLKDSKGSLRREFDSPCQLVRGFISGGVGEIVFEGEYSYTVFSFTVIEGVCGPREEDIPTTIGETEVSVDSYADDLLAIREMPRDIHGEVIVGSRTVGKRIVFPKNFSGLATIYYERCPHPIAQDTLIVDVDEDSSSLLPILTAYFLLIDGDVERAGEFLMLFNSSVKEKKARRRLSDTGYSDVLRWA